MSIDIQRKKYGIKSARIKWVAGKTERSYEEILQLVQNVLQNTLTNTTAELDAWIRKKVPKRTGKLRDDLLENLRSSNVRKGLLRMVLGTHVNYAGFVNGMSTGKVRHSGELGTAYYHGHSGKIPLNDPEAVGNFWNKLVKYAEERLQLNLKKAKEEFVGLPGEAGKILKEEIK